MYQRICCPIDGSDTAERGLDEAIRLSADQNAQLILLNVVDHSGFTSYSPLVEDLFRENREAGKRLLQTAADNARSRGIDVRSEWVEIFTGRVGTVIAETATSLKCDLIVMGTHGRRGIGRVLLGSDAIAVIGSATMPVLLVK